MADMIYSVVTVKGRKKVIQARAEGLPIPKIVGIAIGDGGKSESGEILQPDETQNVLNHEIMRRQIDGYEYKGETACRYYIRLMPGELTNEKISEMALYDESGDLVAIRNFGGVEVDPGLEVGLELTDSLETGVI